MRQTISFSVVSSSDQFLLYLIYFQLFRTEFSSKLASTPICPLNGTQLVFRSYQRTINNNVTLEAPKGAQIHHQIILDMVRPPMLLAVKGREVLIPLLLQMPKHFLIQVQILRVVADLHQHPKFIRGMVAMETIAIEITTEEVHPVDRELD